MASGWLAHGCGLLTFEIIVFDNEAGGCWLVAAFAAGSCGRQAPKPPVRCVKQVPVSPSFYKVRSWWTRPTKSWLSGNWKRLVVPG